jgi:hypothetical protein
MFNSHTVGGVGKDAAYVVRQIAKHEAPHLLTSSEV